MRLRKRVAGIVVLSALLPLAACGDDDDEGSESSSDTGSETTEAPNDTDGGEEQEPAELREITVAIPAPVTIPFYPLWIAEQRGYLAEEGIRLGDYQKLESSGQVLQAVLTGDIDVGLASLGPLANAGAQGGGIRSVYALYEHEVTQIVVPADSDIDSLEDLEGKTIGSGPSDAGPTVLARGVFSSELGWEEGDQYSFLEVGDGAGANVAFDRGDIDAYVNSFLEMATLDLAGFEYRNIMPETYDEIPNTLAVVSDDLIAEEPELIEGLGRAMAKATVWGTANPEEVTQIMIDEYEPEAGERFDFMRSLVDISNTLFEVPAAGDGQWGWHSQDAIEFQLELLASQGRLEGAEDVVPEDLFTNEFLDAYNDFDPAEL